MKKLVFIWFAIIFLSTNCAFSQSQFSAILTNMEKSLFGIDYSNQKEEIRLARIEENIYGEKSTGDIKNRIARLKVDINADLMGQEIKPKEDTFMEDSDHIKSDMPKEDKSVNYPIVDELEMKIFNKQNKALDIYTRISMMEKQEFSQTYSNEDLNTRVERLKSALLPQKKQNDFLYEDENENFLSDTNLASQNSGYNYFSADSTPKNLFNNNSFNFPFQNKSQNNNNSYSNNTNFDDNIGSNAIETLEKGILKKNYPSDTIDVRISRMEEKLFQVEFLDDDTQTRLNRLSSAYNAKLSSGRYENNKMSQHMSTAIQIGTIVLMILACIL